MWKRLLSTYDWLARIDFARNMVEMLLGKAVWTKIAAVGLSAGLAIVGWFSTAQLVVWQRVAIALLFAVLALLLVNLAARLLDTFRCEGQKRDQTYESAFLMSLHELFAHIHPLPFDDLALRDAIGRDIIDQVAGARLGSYGRRIEGSKRLAMEPIPHNVWARAKFTYWFLNASMDKSSLHLECGRDQPGLAPLHYADVHVIREQALDIWSYIPMRDAARIAYEHSRESVFAKAAERFGDGPDGTLQYYASSILLYHPVYGEKPPSTLRELIPEGLRPSSHLNGACDQLLPYNSKPALRFAATSCSSKRGRR